MLNRNAAWGLYLDNRLKTTVSRFSLEENQKYEDDLFEKHNCFSDSEKIKYELSYLDARNLEHHSDIIKKIIDNFDNIKQEKYEDIKKILVDIQLENNINIGFLGTARKMYDEDYYHVKKLVKK